MSSTVPNCAARIAQPPLFLSCLIAPKTRLSPTVSFQEEEEDDDDDDDDDDASRRGPSRQTIYASTRNVNLARLIAEEAACDGRGSNGTGCLGFRVGGLGCLGLRIVTSEMVCFRGRGREPWVFKRKAPIIIYSPNPKP